MVACAIYLQVRDPIRLPLDHPSPGDGDRQRLGGESA